MGYVQTTRPGLEPAGAADGADAGFDDSLGGDCGGLLFALGFVAFGGDDLGRSRVSRFDGGFDVGLAGDVGDT